MKKALFVALLAVVAAGASFAKSPAGLAPDGKTLGPGKYTATVKAIVCSDCVTEIVKTMKAVSGIVSVEIDPASSRLSFIVERGHKISLAWLQKKLAAAARQVGMGADYSLRDVKMKSKAWARG